MERSYDDPLPMSVPEERARDFDALFHSYYGRLARLLYRVTGDVGRAEEVASEAFWRLHRKPPRSHANLEGWLYRTGLRLALDQLRKERRRARYEGLASLFSNAKATEAAIETSEETERVRQTLAALRPNHASLILLRSEGLSYAELAAALNVNPTSVGTLMARAEQAFRKEYEKQHAKR